MYQNNYYQAQNGGLVRVKDENDVINYPIAPGYSVVFIDEGVNHLYVKTAGLSQFERPQIEKFELLRQTGANDTDKSLKGEIEALRADFEAFKKEFMGND